MNKKLIRAFLALCAAAGFLSSFLVPCYSSEGQVFSAAKLVEDSMIEKKVEISAAKFEDVDEESWYFPYVDMLVKNGIINGISDTEYAPTGTFNAAECAAVITRYLGLEEYASERKKQLEKEGIAGAENWYSGYVQTLFDTGIISEGQFGTETKDGYVIINSVEEFSRPLKRYEFAVMITNSFDIDTDIVSAKNLYPEINANGNNFIVGGKYDGTVEWYANKINDYWYIHDEYQWAVLQAYYNGIFNGDENGNFNPGAHLTRAEMSKVVAVIKDPSMRVREEYRELSSELIFDDESFVIDGWGEKALDRGVAKNAMTAIAAGLSIGKENGEGRIYFTPCNYPQGYFAQVYFYDKAQGGCVQVGETVLSDNKTISFAAKEPFAILVLRNSKDAKIEGALRVEFDGNGKIVCDDLFKPVL